MDVGLKADLHVHSKMSTRPSQSNVYDLKAYLTAESICHALAHPMIDLNQKLSLSFSEKMLLLFTHFELNGSRDDFRTRHWKAFSTV